MRVRMLDKPEAVQLLNERACPIRFNLTEEGFPFHLPVFQELEKALLSTPWYRINFALHFVIDARGTRIFTSQFADFVDAILSEDNPELFTVDRLEAALNRHDRWLNAVHKSADGGTELRNIEASLDAMRSRGKAVFGEPRFWTSAFIGSRLNEWPFVLSLLEPGRSAPGVRNSVVHALGALFVDDSPIDPVAASTLRAVYPEDFTEPALPSVGSADVPNSVKIQAAQELEKLTGVSMGGNPEGAARWYSENRDKADWRIEWSDDPRLKYAFTVPHE